MEKLIFYCIFSLIITALVTLTIFGGGIRPSERVATSLYDYDDIEEPKEDENV